MTNHAYGARRLSHYGLKHRFAIVVAAVVDEYDFAGFAHESLSDLLGQAANIFRLVVDRYYNRNINDSTLIEPDAPNLNVCSMIAEYIEVISGNRWHNRHS